MGGVLGLVRGAGAAVWAWLEGNPRRTLVVAIGLSALLRLPFVTEPLASDEGGFLLVADQWHAGGSSLYGDQWVDRPPLLLLIFKLAASLGGSSIVVRALAFGFACGTIVAAFYAGRVVNGSRGAVAAALVAAAIGANESLDGIWLTGETIAGAFVMASIALILHATYAARSGHHSLVLAVLAGTSAGCAFLVKQSFVDAGIFAFVLLGLKLHQRWRLLLGGSAGLAFPLLVTALWAHSEQGPGLVRLWNALYRFRQRALDVMEAAGSDSPAERARELLLAALLVGVFFLIAQVLVAAVRVPERRTMRAAIVITLAYEIAAVVLGANWWAHYALQLVPTLAVGAALATRARARRLTTHSVTSYAIVASVVTAIYIASLTATGNHGRYGDDAVADYLREASKPGDSAFVAYGTPSIIWRAGLTTPYQYSWSLPMRVRDARLRQLVETLQGPDAPTWLVEMESFDWWSIDTVAFETVRLERYHLVTQICGKNVFLLNDAGPRALPTDMSCSRP